MSSPSTATNLDTSHVPVDVLPATLNNQSQPEPDTQAVDASTTADQLEKARIAPASNQPSVHARLLPILGYSFKKISPWIVPVLILLFWQFASQSGWLQSRVLPSPVNVAKAFYHLSVSGELWTHVKVSAGRALLGLLVGGGLGRAAAAHLLNGGVLVAGGGAEVGHGFRGAKRRY